MNYLRQKQMLLILDNFEHLVSGSAVVTNLLTAAPEVKILATTRQKLRLRCETCFYITGLHVQKWETAAQAQTASVVQLLLQSARRVRPEFWLDDDNLEAVSIICRKVQGMPLGIELAASWVDVLTLEEIVKGIDDEIDFLAVDFQDVPERHRSMRGVLEQTLHLIQAKERAIFLRLCVFRGGFTGKRPGKLPALIFKP